MQDEAKEGLPKEMIDKIKRMKMGKSGQDCSVCSEGFRKGNIFICNYFYLLQARRSENCLASIFSTINVSCPGWI